MDDLKRRLEFGGVWYFNRETQDTVIKRCNEIMHEAAARITALEASERTAFQRGAEKMREMATEVCLVEAPTWHEFTGNPCERLAKAIRALPIPTPAPEGEQ